MSLNTDYHDLLMGLITSEEYMRRLRERVALARERCRARNA